MSTGEVIKTNRIRLGLSQRELGEKVGVNKAAVQKWESGKVINLKREKIEMLASIFGISADELIGINPNAEKWDEEYNPNGVLANESQVFDAVSKLFGEHAAELLHNFEQLNQTGQMKAIDNISDLLKIEQYRK